MKVGDRVLVNDKYLGTIVNISDYREPEFKYAIDLDCYKDDLVFVGDANITCVKGADNVQNQ